MQLEAYVRDILHFTDHALIQDFINISRVFTLKKEDLLIRQGEESPYVYVLVSGVVRGYLIDVNGKEITDCFCHESGQFMATSVDLVAASPINVEASTDCTFIALPTKRVAQWFTEFPEATEIYRESIVQTYQRHWSIKMATYQYSATERYRWFLSTYPGLIEKVSHKHIASFLNMTPVTLSRLRHSLSDTSSTQ